MFSFEKLIHIKYKNRNIIDIYGVLYLLVKSDHISRHKVYITSSDIINIFVNKRLYCDQYWLFKIDDNTGLRISDGNYHLYNRGEPFITVGYEEAIKIRQAFIDCMELVYKENTKNIYTYI